MDTQESSIEREDEIFQQTVNQIEEWWQTPKQSSISRPYRAQQIAPLRSPLDVDFPANKQALKLWAQLSQHRQDGTAEMTFGMIDPILATQMVGQQTIYISGALCAFSEAECSGQDTSDYPWDTVPRVAERMFRSQRYHDRKQRQYRMQLSREQRLSLPGPRDFLQPIIADADMGFGSTTSVVKLVQRLVEAGVAMFHIDDLAIGNKRFTSGEGPTVVSTRDYLKRLCAARMQLDIMGAETLIIARCDVDGSQFITSNNDSRDHAYILGATEHVEPLADVLRRIDPYNVGARKEATDSWLKEAKLVTFDDAVKLAATPAQFEIYCGKLGEKKFHSLGERRVYAKHALGSGEAPFFDWELPRTEDGRFRFKPTTHTIVERCLESAPLGEVTWARMDFVWENLVQVHECIRAVHPERLFAAGYGATYDFKARGYSEDDVRDFHLKLAKLGVVWQLQPGFAMQGLNHVTKKFSVNWAKEGIAGYIRDIQGPAMKADTDTYEKMSWSGGYLADAYTNIVEGI